MTERRLVSDRELTHSIQTQ